MLDFIFFTINTIINENGTLFQAAIIYVSGLFSLVMNSLIWNVYIHKGKIIPSFKNKSATCLLFGTLSFLITFLFFHIFLICLIVMGIAEFTGKLQKEWNT